MSTFSEQISSNKAVDFALTWLGRVRRRTAVAEDMAFLNYRLGVCGGLP